MSYVPHTDADRAEMLAAIGVERVEDLFDDVPAACRYPALALPDPLSTLTRPFIAAYWSWSGILQTLRDSRLYDVVQQVTQTDIALSPICIWALFCHILLGLFVAYAGCRMHRELTSLSRFRLF